ncbi:MAG: hypothetical protein ACKKL5_00690 [Candidatus Komeilibacteria bacterium]
MSEVITAATPQTASSNFNDIHDIREANGWPSDWKQQVRQKIYDDAQDRQDDINFAKEEYVLQNERDENQAFSKTLNAHATHRAYEYLHRLQVALESIETEKFGICTQCNKVIEWERIITTPIATKHAHCKEQEKLKNNGRKD